uniref:Uncharacterized protein n=1 Tax=Sus scrofa TaxID=9823 RepID=A0A8D0RZF0_PIG
MRSWYHIWDFFLCKSSSIRRNYGTLSLALENLQWTNRYHQTPNCSHTTGPLLPFHSHSSRLLLAEAESPHFFFFSFRCNKPSSLCSSIVCISLYFIHVLF